MEHISTSELRSRLKHVFDRVNADKEPVAIRRGMGREVVILDGEDYRSIMETLYLVRNPANAERLQKGMAQHRAGQRKQIDVEAYLD